MSKRKPANPRRTTSVNRLEPFTFSIPPGARRLEQRIEANPEAIAKAYAEQYDANTSGTFYTRLSSNGRRIEAKGPGISEFVATEEAEKAAKGSRGRRKKDISDHHDFTYRQHSKLMDQERQTFFDELDDFKPHGRDLSFYEKHQVWRAYLGQQSVTTKGMASSKEKGRHAVTGTLPLTTLTPTLTGAYQNHGYEDIRGDSKEKRKRRRPPTIATGSSRAYEKDFMQNVRDQSNVPPDISRAFFLPDSEADTNLTTALGANLDTNTATSGNTIGQGVLYKAVYSHFKTALQDAHKAADEETSPYTRARQFNDRTQELLDRLDPIDALKQNEKKRLTQGQSETHLFSTIDHLEGEVTKLMATYDSLAQTRDLSETNPFTKEHFDNLIRTPDASGVPTGKQYQLLGSVLGLKIKETKRHIMGKYLLSADMDESTKSHLRNLVSLTEIESAFNAHHVGSLDQPLSKLLKPPAATGKRKRGATKETKPATKTKTQAPKTNRTRSEKNEDVEETSDDDTRVAKKRKKGSSASDTTKGGKKRKSDSENEEESDTKPTKKRKTAVKSKTASSQRQDDPYDEDEWTPKRGRGTRGGVSTDDGKRIKK